MTKPIFIYEFNNDIAGNADGRIIFDGNFCDEKKVIEIANDVVEKDITVRELENMAKRLENVQTDKPKKEKKTEDIYFKEIAEDLSNKWGRKVKISSASKDGKVKGTVEFEFYDNEDFNNLLDIIQKKVR